MIEIPGSRQITVEQILSDATSFDKRFECMNAEGVLLKRDGSLHILTDKIDEKKEKQKTVPLDRSNIFFCEIVQ